MRTNRWTYNRSPFRWTHMNFVGSSGRREKIARISAGDFTFGGLLKR